MTDESKSLAKEGQLLTSRTGRPSQFEEEHISKVLDLMNQGYTNTRICAELSIPSSTFYRWLKEHNDFKTAYDVGKEKREAWWEELGLAGMMGKIPRFNATIYDKLTKTKLGWRDTDDIAKTANINIENMQVLQNMQHLSEQELDSKIQLLIANLQLSTGALEDESIRREEGADSFISGERDEEEV